MLSIIEGSGLHQYLCDIIFQEGKEQALYFDARVLDAQRRRHDVRGCRCRFLVRYDHDSSEVLHYPVD